MERIQKFTLAIAAASKGNPVVATCTVMLYGLLFDLLEACVEKLVFGAPFTHWLDPIFIAGWIAFGAYTVWCCAVYNSASNASLTGGSAATENHDE